MLADASCKISECQLIFVTSFHNPKGSLISKCTPFQKQTNKTKTKQYKNKNAWICKNHYATLHADVNLPQFRTLQFRLLCKLNNCLEITLALYWLAAYLSPDAFWDFTLVLWDHKSQFEWEWGLMLKQSCNAHDSNVCDASM